MSFSAFKTLLPPTGVGHCAPAFLTHCPGDRKQGEQTPLELGTWAAAAGTDEEGRLLPNLVVVKANRLEVYIVRTPNKEEGNEHGSQAPWFELVTESSLYGNVESVAVLKSRQDDLTGQRSQHDALVLAFRDARLSVLEWDDQEQQLRTSSLHCFESAKWQLLKRGLEKLPHGPIVKADPQGRCAAALLYEDQLLVMKARASGLGFGEEEPAHVAETAASIEGTYFVDLCTLGVKNVKDMVFLHGYLEPALLLLHEPDPTWGGRAAVKRFTCVATVLSLNTTLKQHPEIFTAHSLPYDAYQTVAVPSPLGGALILAANTLHYFSQTASITLGINSFAAVPEGAAPFPDSSFEVELDVARLTWLSSNVGLVATKTGLLLLLTLSIGGRTVQSLELTKSIGAVLASSICTLSGSLLFLGSRLGDSMLIGYKQGSQANDEAVEKELEQDDVRGEPPAKRARHGDVSEAAPESQDELSLYGTTREEDEDRASQQSFSFTVCDTLVNIGPIRDLVIGKRTKSDAQDEAQPPRTESELVLCSGHAKNGALCILHQTIRPSITTEVDLGGTCRGIWAVHQQGESGSDPANDFHSFLVISLEDGTRVLTTGDDIAELDDDETGFFTAGPTVAVGSLFDRSRILQVHAQGFHLLEGFALRSEVPLFEFPSLPTEGDQPDAKLSIVSVSILDPFALFLLSDGSVRLGECDESEKEVLVGLVSLRDPLTSTVTAVHLFEDPLGHVAAGRRGVVKQRSIVAAIARSSGEIDMYSLPSFDLLTSLVGVTQGKRIISHTTEAINNPSNAQVTSLVISSASHKQESSQPSLCAVLSSGSVLAYRGFHAGKHSHLASQSQRPVPPSQGENRPESQNVDGSNQRQAGQRMCWIRVAVEGADALADGASSPSLVAYEDINNTSGAFLCASRPAWLMECRGRLRAHLQLNDGPIKAFSAFHNVHNPHGFVYVTAEGNLRIAQLPIDCVYNAQWPVTKVPLKATPHRLAYLPDTDLYAVAVSTPVELPFHQPPGTPHDDNATEDGDMNAPRQWQNDVGPVYCELERFELRLLNPATWESAASIPMHRYEHIAAVDAVTLKHFASEKRDALVAVGTTTVLGEDAPSSGRVLLYRVAKNDQGTELRAVYMEEHRAGITALSSVQGCLLAAVGSKLILFRWNGDTEKLITAAFFDAPMYVTSLSSVKSYVLLGDFQRSVHFLHWVDTPAMSQLRELAKDYALGSVTDTSFITDGKALALVAADFDGNVKVFEYFPTTAPLLCKAAFHVGSLIARFLRIDMAQQAGAPKRLRSAALFGTVDGAVEILAPLDEMTFRRLQALHRRMTDSLEHAAGLNPRFFRQRKGGARAGPPVPDTVVDLDLVCEFEMLSHDRQTILARQVGTTQERVLADIHDFRVGTTCAP